MLLNVTDGLQVSVWVSSAPIPHRPPARPVGHLRSSPSPIGGSSAILRRLPEEGCILGQLHVLPSVLLHNLKDVERKQRGGSNREVGGLTWAGDGTTRGEEVHGKNNTTEEEISGGNLWGASCQTVSWRRPRCGEEEEGGGVEHIHLSSSSFPQSFGVRHEWRRGWESPLAALSNMCEFMQIHMKPEPKMFPVSARREKNQRTQPLNTRSVHPNFILTGRRGTSCSSHILHTIKISLKIQHCDVNNKQVQNSKLLSNKH